MPIESASDRLGMLSDWDTLQVSPGNTYPNRNDKTQAISGILENEHVVIEGVETLSPVLVCRTADITNVVYGSMVENGTVKYKVKSLQPDGTGITTLLLEKQ